MLTQTQIKKLAKKHNFYLRKRLGQNFLIDKNVRDKIIDLIGLKKDDIVLEIGTGLGALTERLAEDCGYVYAVERDRRLFELSKEFLAGYRNLKLVECDFLKFDINRLLFRNMKVVGALPYYITTPIIEHILRFRERIDSIFITVQREVARRMVSRPGDGDYGSFSLFVQFYTDLDLLTDISRNSFFPVPAVDSSLLRLKVLKSPHAEVKDEKTLFKVIRTSFGQRRKTVLSALSHKGALGIGKIEMAEILDGLRIEKEARPETLGLEEFASIANAVIDFSL